jgi:hypothetical protein
VTVTVLHPAAELHLSPRSKMRGGPRRKTPAFSGIRAVLCGRRNHERTLAADGVTFTSYLYETGLFDRAWAQYTRAIETYIGPWLDKRLDWHEAIARLVAAI